MSKDLEVKLSNGEMVSIFDYDGQLVLSVEDAEGEFIATAELDDSHKQQLRELIK